MQKSKTSVIPFSNKQGRLDPNLPVKKKKFVSHSDTQEAALLFAYKTVDSIFCSNTSYFFEDKVSQSKLNAFAQLYLNNSFIYPNNFIVKTYSKSSSKNSCSFYKRNQGSKPFLLDAFVYFFALQQSFQFNVAGAQFSFFSSQAPSFFSTFIHFFQNALERKSSLRTISK